MLGVGRYLNVSFDVPAEMARSDWAGNLRLAYTHCTGVEVVFGRRILNQNRLEAG